MTDASCSSAAFPPAYSAGGCSDQAAGYLGSGPDPAKLGLLELCIRANDVLSGSIYFEKRPNLKQNIMLKKIIFSRCVDESGTGLKE